MLKNNAPAEKDENGGELTIDEGRIAGGEHEQDEKMELVLQAVRLIASLQAVCNCSGCVYGVSLTFDLARY